MNKLRKSKIKSEKISLKCITNRIQRLLDEEQDYYDNIPDNLQSSMRAEDSEEAIDQLEEIINSLEEVIDLLDEI